MKNKQIIRFVESFILLPGLAMSSMPVGSLSQAVVSVVNTPSVVMSEKQSKETAELLALNQAKDQKLKADAIDTYFNDRNMPLKGMGMKMVQEAEKNDLDWRLLAAIAVRESTGGKHACKKATFNS